MSEEYKTEFQKAYERMEGKPWIDPQDSSVANLNKANILFVGFAIFLVISATIGILVSPFFL